MQTVTLTLSLIVLGLVGQGVLGSSSSDSSSASSEPDLELEPCLLRLTSGTVVCNNASVCNANQQCTVYSPSVSLPSGIAALSVCVPTGTCPVPTQCGLNYTCREARCFPDFPTGDRCRPESVSSSQSTEDVCERAETVLKNAVCPPIVP